MVEMAETKVMSYHEYKKRLKKISEEIRKENRKSSNKKKKSENLLNLEKELAELNKLYNEKENGEDLSRKEENEKSVNNINNIENILEGNLYSFNEKLSKKLLKRNEKLKARDKEEEERELENSKNNYGQVECEQLLENLKRIQKTIHFIAPDGNCLYESIIHQLKEKAKNNLSSYKFEEKDFLKTIGKEHFSLKEVELELYVENGGIVFDFQLYPFMHPSELNSDILRFLTAVYIMQNKSLFESYIYVNEDEKSSDDPLLMYCQSIIDGAYGSELEIKALSEIFKKQIVVYDIHMNVSYGEDYCDILHICFHHKLYALGKHYNSVVDLPESV